MMPPKYTLALAAGLLLGLAPHVAAADAPPKITYQEHVSAIFQARCNSCHNADKQKGGLTLENFGGVMQGGGSGTVIEPGDPDSSTLFLLVSHAEEPKMPPNQPKLPDAELAVIKQWIAGGAPETSGSVVAAAKPKNDFKLDPSAIGKPAGPPAMPEGLSTDPIVVSARPNAITALAASPWAPLAAVSGHKQVLLYHTATRRLVGVLPFPEGTVHVLKFSRDGGVLLAGGGRGGQTGRVVVWDVKTGKRLFEVGKEYDSVLAADVSPDRSLVALGGPSRILRVYSTEDGELVYEQKKHTEWVTALEFSPDGVLLASGDRNGGLVVWEAQTGREFYDLRGHTLAITDISWRLDSNVVASASEDASVRLWEMNNGNQIKTWNAHGGGTASARFAQDGRLVTTGRDRTAKQWDQNGTAQRQFEGFNDLALQAVFTFDAGAVVAGDWTGEVRLWETKEGKRLGNLVANPAPVAVRLAELRQQADAAQGAADASSKEFAALQAAAGEKAAALTKAQQALAAAQQNAAKLTADLAAAQQGLAAKTLARQASSATATIAQAAGTRAVAAQDAARRDLAQREATEKATAATAAATKTERDQMLAAQAASARVAAVQVAEAAPAQVAATAEAAKVAKAAADQVVAELTAANAALTATRTALQAATALLPTRKAELAAATAAQAAAGKAVADRKPAADAALAQAAALKAEVEALAAEKQAGDITRSAMATPAANP